MNFMTVVYVGVVCVLNNNVLPADLLPVVYAFLASGSPPLIN